MISVGLSFRYESANASLIDRATDLSFIFYSSSLWCILDKELHDPFVVDQRLGFPKNQSLGASLVAIQSNIRVVIFKTIA
jgi:hypothetical protein